jgi:hypothetical protein
MEQTLPWEDETQPAEAPATRPAGERVATLPPPVPEPESSLPASAASEPGRRTRRTKGLTPEQRVLRSRLAAYQLHATHDPKETTKKAREAFAARFEREVDPDGVLSPEERARRADAARRAYFTRLALRSSRARRRAG